MMIDKIFGFHNNIDLWNLSLNNLNLLLAEITDDFEVTQDERYATAAQAIFDVICSKENSIEIGEYNED